MTNARRERRAGREEASVEIGKEIETYTVEPVEDPVPREEPRPAETQPEPAEAPTQ
jgi:hypothetical protein